MKMIIIIIFIFLLVIGAPIVFVLGISGAASIIQANFSLVLIPQRMFVGLNSFLLISVPLFILAGNLMDACGITPRIVNFSNMLVGRIRGGLSFVTLVAMDFSSGITGAGAADTAAIGSFMIPVMIKEGYKAEYAAGLMAVGATVGPIIPPSIAFVIYGAMTEVSIAALFLAGFIPGFMFTLAMMAVARYYAVKQNHPVRIIEITWKGFFKATIEALPAIMMPLLVLGGILTGIFTPTEAAGAGVFLLPCHWAICLSRIKTRTALAYLKRNGNHVRGDYAPCGQCIPFLMDSCCRRDSPEGSRWDTLSHPESLYRPFLDQPSPPLHGLYHGDTGDHHHPCTGVAPPYHIFGNRSSPFWCGDGGQSQHRIGDSSCGSESLRRRRYCQDLS